MSSCPRTTSESASICAASALSSTTRIRSPAVAGRRACRRGVRRGSSGSPASAASGRRIANVAPRPLPSLCASTVPPCASTRLFTMARPSPSPPSERSISWRSCANRSKMRGSISGAIPPPLSDTVTRARDGLAVGRRRDHAACGRCTSPRWSSRLATTWQARARRRRPPDPAGRRTVSACRRLLDRRARHLDRLGDDVGEVDAARA